MRRKAALRTSVFITFGDIWQIWSPLGTLGEERGAGGGLGSQKCDFEDQPKRSKSGCGMGSVHNSKKTRFISAVFRCRFRAEFATEKTLYLCVFVEIATSE